MSTKIQNLSGWLLLIIGLLIIAFGLYSSFNVFTGRKTAPELFKFGNTGFQSLATTTTNKIPTNSAELQKEMEEIVNLQIRELIPFEAVSKLLNLIVWSIFLAILIFAGAQISGLGIKLLKE